MNTDWREHERWGFNSNCLAFCVAVCVEAADYVLTMISSAAAFIRRNIVIVLAFPPVVAASFGAYAKLIRVRTQQSSPATEECTEE